MAEYKRVCNFCHKDFIAQKITTKFCSHRCASLVYKMKVRQEQQNMFNDNEAYKRLLYQIVDSLEKIELALNFRNKKEEFSEEELLTAYKFCELKNIHKRILRRMIEREEIKVVKHQNKIFINNKGLNCRNI